MWTCKDLYGIVLGVSRCVKICQDNFMFFSHAASSCIIHLVARFPLLYCNSSWCSLYHLVSNCTFDLQMCFTPKPCAHFEHRRAKVFWRCCVFNWFHTLDLQMCVPPCAWCLGRMHFLNISSCKSVPGISRAGVALIVFAFLTCDCASRLGRVHFLLPVLQTSPDSPPNPPL